MSNRSRDSAWVDNGVATPGRGEEARRAAARCQRSNTGDAGSSGDRDALVHTVIRNPPDNGYGYTTEHFEGDREAEVRRLAELGAARLAEAPELAEAHFREAIVLGTGALAAHVCATLSSQLVIAICAQPDRDVDLAEAAVRAATAWTGLSDQNVRHYTVVAARALARATRHGEAVALFEQALAGEELPYPAAESAIVRAQFARSLAAVRRSSDAVWHFAEAARLLEHEPGQADLLAELACSAAHAWESGGRAAVVSACGAAVAAGGSARRIRAVHARGGVVAAAECGRGRRAPTVDRDDAGAARGSDAPVRRRWCTRGRRWCTRGRGLVLARRRTP
ncbi:hypothetical protein [Nocardia callitridis]|uniref:hypothetical protein n=1 Tax=Nocardia callitridis TaxID=648753 RepID=UPI0031F0E441